MTTSCDYAPLFRSSVGFDRMFNLLENAQRARSTTGNDNCRISVAVRGFTQDDLNITFPSNLLTATGRKQELSAGGYLHHGIPARPFEHRFELADHVRITGADLNNGLLTIRSKLSDNRCAFNSKRAPPRRGARQH